MRYYLGHWQWTTANGMACFAPPAGVVGCLDLGTLPQMSVGGADRGRLLCWTHDAVTLPSEYELLGVGDCREINTDGAMLDKFQSLVGYRPHGDKLVDAVWDCLEGGADIDGAIGPLPLVPTTRGNLELHFAGHSVVKSRRFKWGSDAASPKLKQLLRKEFRGLLQNAKAGKLKDNKHHLRVLDYWCDKYGVSDWREFVPANLQKDVPGRVKHETTITDNFNRADGSLGSSSEGWSWTVTGGSWAIDTNRAKSTSTNSYARAEFDLSSADHYAQMSVVGGFSSPANSELLVRQSASVAFTHYMYVVREGSSSTTHRIYKAIVGVYTLLSTVAETSPVAPFTMRNSVNGSSITGSIGGVSKIGPLSDTGISGNLRTGMSAESTADQIFDGFQAADLAAGTVIPVLRHHYVSQGTA